MALYPAHLARHASRFSVRRWPILLALGGLSWLVYWVGLILPYNLFALDLRPLLNIARLTRNRPADQAGFVLTFAALSGVYYLAWRLCRPPFLGEASRAIEHEPAQRRRLWVALLASLAAANFSMLWMYPIGAADLFDNIMHGRITAQWESNPFYATPNAFPNDPFRVYSAWPKSRSAYGPLWELLAAGTSRIVGDAKLANVLGFKLLGLLFYAGCAALIAGILDKHAPSRTLQGVCLFAWNPLVIYETAGNGHNDIVMVFWILLAAFALSRHRFTLAALALTAGALIKFVPVLLLPIILASGMRALPARRSRLGYLAGSLLVCILMIGAAYAVFWRGGDILGIQRRVGLFTASLPAFVQAQLEGRAGSATSRQIVTWAALALTILAVTLQVRQTWRGTDWLTPIRASAIVLLFYLLVTCLWFQSWYALWPLALAALLPEGALGRTAVLLTYSALWKTIIFDFFLYRGGPLPPRPWRETLLGPSLLGLTWLYAAYVLLAKFRLRVTDRRARGSTAISNPPTASPIRNP